MSYKNTVHFRPGNKYPFLLATEADGIPLTQSELEALHSECERALMALDDYLFEQRNMEPHKRDGYSEKMADQADYLRKARREARF